MLQLCVIPGPKKPEDFESFLKPIMAELKALQNGGIEVKVGPTILSAKAYVLYVTGDIPAVSAIANLSGHTSGFGCRLCKIFGKPNSITKKGKYFQMKDAPSQWRTKEEYQAGNEVSTSIGKI